MNHEELKEALKRLGLSRQELADGLGVALITVKVWASGGRDIPPYVRAYLTAQAKIRELEDAVGNLRTMLLDSERRAAAIPSGGSYGEQSRIRDLENTVSSLRELLFDSERRAAVAAE